MTITATNDLLCYHTAGLLAAYLRAEWGAARVVDAYAYPPTSLSAARCPCVAVYRESEDLSAYPGRRMADVTLAIAYYAGPNAGAAGQRGVPWGDVFVAARWIDRALQDGRHATYQSGQDLSTLAGVLERGGADVTYPAPAIQDAAEDVYPSVLLRYTLRVRDSFPLSPAETLDKITIDVNQPLPARAAGLPIDEIV